MVEREAVIAPDRADEAADEDGDVDDEGQQRPGDRDAVAQPAQPARQRHRQAGVTLPGDGGVRRAPEPALLGPERRQREDQQHQGEHRGAALVVRGADYGKEHLGRQHFEIPGEHQRIAEVRHALHEAQQKGGREPGPKQRQGHRAECRPTARAQRLRGFLERRADALHHPEQDEESDGREGEQLRKRHAGEAIDPARARNVEPVVEQPADRTRPAEEQDDGKADDEGRRDDRQHAHHAQHAFVAERGARRDQREREPQQRRAGADHDRQQHGVPSHAAAQAGVQAIQAPDRPVEEAGDEVAFERAREHDEDRQEHERRDARDHQSDRADHEGVAAAETARREPLTEQHQKADGGKQRAIAHSRLRRPTGRGNVGMPEQETLQQHQHDSRAAHQDQDRCRGAALAAPGTRRQRRDQRQEKREQPG